jgi:hypothetical protein
VQAGAMPSKSRKPREWPIHPKPDIPGRLPERLLRPNSSRSTGINQRPKLGSRKEPASVDYWVIPLILLPVRCCSTRNAQRAKTSRFRRTAC